MSGKDIKAVIKTAVSLFLICAVAAGVLAYVNSVTDPIIDANEAKKEEEAMLEVQPDAERFDAITLPSGEGSRAVGKDGSTIGYVFTTTANSYGGELKVMTGFTADGVITGVRILTIDDTPGLGMNAKKESFYGQYDGHGVLGADGAAAALAVNKDGGDIDAITSATITSRAVTSAVNKAGALLAEAIAEEG